MTAMHPAAPLRRGVGDPPRRRPACARGVGP
jgi:hypothetical protein